MSFERERPVLQKKCNKIICFKPPLEKSEGVFLWRELRTSGVLIQCIYSALCRQSRQDISKKWKEAKIQLIMAILLISYGLYNRIRM